MRKWFRQLSLKKKLTLIILMASLAALMLTGTSLAIFGFFMLRYSLVENVSTIASLIANNAPADLKWGDPKEAAANLAVLRVQPNIVAACLYDKEGRLFATYFKHPQAAPAIPAQPQADHHRFGPNRLEYFQPLVFKGEFVGTFYLQSNLDQFYTYLRRYLGIMGGLFVISLIVAWLLSSRLQRVISLPILRLAHLTRQVSQEKNYALRAWKKNPDELGKLVDDFNDMLAQIHMRDAALHESRELYQQLALNASDLPYRVHTETNQMEWYGQVDQALGYEAMAFPRTRAGWLDHIHPEDRSAVLAAYETSCQTGAVFAMEYRMRHRNGDYIYWSDRGRPARDPAGRLARFYGACSDITKRKVAEEELKGLHQQLLEASRKAGRAEVATGVLHNVGNVLNSVNVSTNLLQDQLRQSKLPRLGQAVALLQDHDSDLGNYLTQDAKGKLLPAYLVQLAGHLLEEQAVWRTELLDLVKNVEHIKEIVALQQNYARVSGVLETLPVTHVVEDALQMNAAAFNRHGVAIIRQYQDVPPVTVDKHKVLQILINLLRNAKYAMDEKPGIYPKQLTVRVGLSEKHEVQVVVQDNGMGIPAENLTRIFSHGFTTKKNGHGFGLHVGALAAREMGGSLCAQSEGLGRGASFILALPASQNHQSHGRASGPPMQC